MESQSRVSLAWDLAKDKTKILVLAMLYGAASLLWVCTWVFVLIANESNFSPQCGGVRGMDATSGWLYLIAVVTGVAVPLILAAVCAIGRSWLFAAGWLLISVLSLGVLVHLDVATPAGIRHAVQVIEHPPAFEPGSFAQRRDADQWMHFCER